MFKLLLKIFIIMSYLICFKLDPDPMSMMLLILNLYWRDSVKCTRYKNFTFKIISFIIIAENLGCYELLSVAVGCIEIFNETIQSCIDYCYRQGNGYALVNQESTNYLYCVCMSTLNSPLLISKAPSDCTAWCDYDGECCGGSSSMVYTGAWVIPTCKVKGSWYYISTRRYSAFAVLNSTGYYHSHLFPR